MIVISPPISLMVSQIDDLRKRNQSTVRLTHDSSKEDECRLFNDSIRYIFLAPEALNERKWKSLLMTPSFNNSVKAVVCDEALCVELWGSSIEPFCQSYSNLVSLQAFLTSSIPYVALTATASISTRVKICQMLNMINSVLITCSPNRINLRCSVIHGHEDISIRFKWLLEELRSKKTDTVKTVMFCKSIASCACLYRLFDFDLKGYIPSGAKSINNALFGMYHAIITAYEKGALLDSFSKRNGVCRILFCTIAFGMGLNISNIYRVIHDAPAGSVDQYVQESGRGGRDGYLCEVVLYLYPGSTRDKINLEMKGYCKNAKQCCHNQLMQYFPGQFELPQPKHLCCDLCATTCLCNCTCRTCYCSRQSHPCSNCCTRAIHCTSVQEIEVGTKGASPKAYESSSCESEEITTESEYT